MFGFVMEHSDVKDWLWAYCVLNNSPEENSKVFPGRREQVRQKKCKTDHTTFRDY